MMTTHEEAAGSKTGRPSDASHPSVPRRRDTTLQQRITARRRNSKALDQWVDRNYGETDSPSLNRTPHECGKWHAGPCDWWGACTGMNLGVDQRERAGGVG